MIIAWLSLSALAAAFYAYWFETPWYFAVILFAVNAALLAVYKLLFRFGGGHQQQQMFALLKEQKDQLNELEKALNDLGQPKAAQQITNLTDKVSDLKEVASLRFSEGEIAMNRYVGAASQVSQQVVRNLTEIRIAKTSIQSIDPESISEKIKEAHGDEHDQLEARLTLLEEQTNKINRLIEDNTRAITSIAKTATALADIKQVSDFEQHAVMEELQQLAEKAELFNK